MRTSNLLSARRRASRISATALAFWLVLVGAAEADTPRALSFEEAFSELMTVSDRLSGEAATVRAARDSLAATRLLHAPLISLDAQELRYQKTLEIQLGGLQNVGGVAALGALSGVEPAAIPGAPGDPVGAITRQVRLALPSAFAGIPDSISLSTRQTLFHPTATAIMQLYSGGAIAAAQDTAKAALELARARQAAGRDDTQLELVRDYFGQALAAEVLTVARDTRDGFDRHLADAEKLEREGVISRAQRLQVQVARDTAQRAVERAEGDYQTAADTLAALVHGGGVSPTTPLFVDSRPLGPVRPFIDAAEGGHPKLREARAGVEAARQGVKLERSRRLPWVYGFAAYNLNRDDELVIEPDWIIGVGVHLTVFSNLDRRKAESAARERRRAAEASERQTRVDLRTNVTRAWNLVETARRQFLELDSSIAAATESLRVQETSFREGVATAAEVTDARNALGQAKVQRAAAAYEYDLALAALLVASGQTGRFVDHLRAADRRVSTR
jgi:outer membrane protein TolC